MALGELDQLGDALGIDPVVCRHQLAVLGVRGNRPERSIVILDDSDDTGSLLVTIDLGVSCSAYSCAIASVRSVLRLSTIV